jgi:hypothetical protein
MPTYFVFKTKKNTFSVLQCFDLIVFNSTLKEASLELQPRSIKSVCQSVKQSLEQFLNKKKKKKKKNFFWPNIFQLLHHREMTANDAPVKTP